MFVWAALEENARSATKLWIIMEVCSNRGFLLEQWKIYQKQKPLGNPMLKRYLDGRVTWKVMQRNEWKDIANLRIKQLSNSFKSRRHAWMTINLRKKISWRIVHSLLTIVLTCLYLARIGRPDIFWSVNKLARAITKWASACDKRLARLISYIHHTRVFKQYCHVGNSTKCRSGIFQDSDFAGDSEDSKLTSGGLLCILGSHAFVPISKTQTSVAHSSTEAEVISLDAGLRMDCLPALDLWNLVTEVFHSSQNQSNKTKGLSAQENLLLHTTSSKHTRQNVNQA